MPTTNSEQQWLSDFVSLGDEGAFEMLVGCHIDLVLGCALRMTRDQGLAEEISQNVFTILARKASKLKAGSGLAGWLHKTTLFETKKVLRGRSRQQRKMIALANHTEIEDAAQSPEGQILPLVDEAIDELPDGDRELLLLHFLEGHTFAEISQQRGKSEGACQKQASRALAKLRAILGRRGAVASATAIGSLLAAQSTKAASAGLITTISGGAVAGAASISTPALITNAIQTMTYAKTKVAILVAATAAVPMGVQMKANSELKEELSTYQQRETEYIAQAERVVQIEEQIAALPTGDGGSPGTAWESGGGAGPRRSNAGAQPSAIVASKGNRGSSTARRGTDGSDPAAAEDVAEGLDFTGAFGSFDEMMENPVMRRQLKMQMEGHIETQYGALLDYLELGDERRQKVSDELVAQLLSADDSEDPPNLEAIVALQSEHEDRLRTLLGEEKYEVFERFEDSSDEREELAVYRDSLEEQGMELSAELERQLMAIMFDEKTGAADVEAVAPPAGESASAVPSLSAGDAILIAEAENLMQGILSPAAAAAVIEDQRGVQARVLARAAELLTPEQLSIFESNQESHLDMLRGSFAEMAKERRTGGGE